MLPRRLLAAATLASAALAQEALAQEWRPRRSGDGFPLPEPGRRDWVEQVPQIRVGLIGGENETDRLARFDGLRNLLEATYQVPVRLFPTTDYAGVQQAMAARQVDIAYLGASAYAATWIDTNGAVMPLLSFEQEDGGTTYVPVMVVRTDSGITSLEEMRGRSLAWADPNSTSGYLIPRFELRRAGIGVEPGQYFSRTGFAGGHEQGVVAVLQRQYDAAMTWGSGLGDPAAGYSRGILRAMIEKGMLRPGEFRVVWQGRPIQNGPITIRTELPAAFREDITRFYLSLPAARPDIFRQIARGEGVGFREVRHQDYELFVELRREEAAMRRRRS